jgi:hypothetical protein
MRGSDFAELKAFAATQTGVILSRLFGPSSIVCSTDNRARDWLYRHCNEAGFSLPTKADLILFAWEPTAHFGETRVSVAKSIGQTVGHGHCRQPVRACSR